MSFPSIRSQITDFATSNESTHIVSLPSVVVVNDILIVIIRVIRDGNIGWPVGWTELFDIDTDPSNDKMACAWKVANGSEGGTTINVTSGNGKFVSVSTGVQDAVSLSLGTIAVGNNPTQPNAGICNPGSLKDYLFLTFYGMEGEQTGIASYPSNYVLGQSGIVTSSISGAVQNNCTMACASRQLAAVSEDSGPWSISGSLRGWMAGTIAFHPPTPPSGFLPSGGSSMPF